MNRGTTLCIVLSATIFVVGLLVGGVLTAEQSIDVEQRSEIESVEKTPTVATILTRNVRVFASGMVPIFAPVTLFVNGFHIGNVVFKGFVMGYSPRVLLALVAPHGLLEYTGLLLAGAVGFRSTYEFIRYFLGLQNNVVNNRTRGEIVTLVGLGLMLILLAAVVEVYITPRIAGYVLNG